MMIDNKLNLNIDEDESLSKERPPRNQSFLWEDFEKDMFEARRKSLAGRFVVPPFSILDTRQGYWQQGKQLWLDLGIKSELGRGELRNNEKITHAGVLHTGKTGIEWEDEYKGGDCWRGIGTSVFDPVLCEIIYKWFCPSRGYILDPFAGGSVRGIVAEYLDYKYTGIELRNEQVEANIEQAKKIKLSPRWIVGDSELRLDDLSNKQFDFIFSCPPYFNLEIYSNLLGELSALKEYPDFLNKYKNIIKKSCLLLRLNHFACFVVSNIRNKKTGYLYPLVSDTIRCFKEVGMSLYNEAILVNSAGSLPIRIGRQFKAGRKLGKMHQNILIFKKG